MKVDYITASHSMKKVTGVIDNNVFDLDKSGLLIISVKVKETEYSSYPLLEYELLNEAEREEWFIENTPCCGDRTHVGWSCDSKGCYPF